MAVLAGAGGGRRREAVTEVWVRERLGLATLVEAKLATGRTHQIRVHLSHLGHALLGDPSYGLHQGRQLADLLGPGARQALEALGGQALHAYRLSFTHPRTGERMTFEAPLPAPMQELLAALRREGGGPARTP